MLVTESGGSTNVTEPTRFVVLGDGFVTAVDVQRDCTTFMGDFGTAVLNEVEGHNTRENATDLELGKWNRTRTRTSATSTAASTSSRT